ncbi:hypothetical protein AMATHDRAFT_1982 [Amanita thiersii Skay4041]|uniref:Uncharacterized protein n=1 Tax=Amanita thiersii Skay4041 TaxID=703135 RepID=A0A2A9NW69_9AGAR|nr:hypothetical protein AMATHDRAFT_1982 [Amanita thiersii Skay4041]
MKSLRKSLGGGSHKDSNRPLISTPLPLGAVSTPPPSILPPQKVIRALSAYAAQAPQEISFQKGDFFYVIKDADDSQWYEAHNPVSGARGLVPRQFFEEFNKNTIPARVSQISPMTSQSIPASGSSLRASVTTSRAPKTQVYYAIVQHDFVAERQDELDAKRGDAITVVAQSNREWFVAKPIGRLGRPGLIPVTFVQIHDPTTGQPIDDVEGLIDSGGLPKVEEWKRAMISYKQNSIPLGVIDSPTRTSVPNSPYTQQQHESKTFSQVSTATHPGYVSGSGSTMPVPCLPEGILLVADVVSFHHEMDEYWFRVDAIFQPYGRSDEDLPAAKHLILFRAYNDFYDFQVSLLETFPSEAGRQPPHQRVLPYMPGPVDEVSDALTISRREELDEYVHSLCELSKVGYRYILEHIAIRQFLALKPGDVEKEVAPRGDELGALPPSHYPDDDYESVLQERLDNLDLHNGHRASDGSQYEDEGYAPSPQQHAAERSQHSYNYTGGPIIKRFSQENSKAQGQAHHQRTGSSTSFYRTSSPYHSRSRSASPQQYDAHGGQWHDSTYQSNHAHQAKNYAHHPHNPYTHTSTPSVSSLRSSQATPSRSRSHSAGASANLNNPPISAANPQTAFIKIKIFDKISDDLVAIRVHPRVTHAELMDKVQARLGNGVSYLKYRDSMTNSFVDLGTDEELKFWIEGADKHVLFAE